MNMSAYRKLVSKSVDTKSAKTGLRLATKSNKSTNLALGVFGLSASVSNVLGALNPYLMGQLFAGDVKAATFTQMSALSADIVFMAKLLKVKLPTPTKKVKLVGSRTENLLTLQQLTAAIQGAYAATTLAPIMQFVEKEVPLPSEGGKKEVRNVLVVDKPAMAEAQTALESSIASYMKPIIDIFWGLSFDMFQTPPQPLFDAQAEAYAGFSTEIVGVAA